MTRVWIPRGFFECHRTGEHSQRTIDALKREGIHCLTDEDPATADAAEVLLCGSFPLYSHFQQGRLRRANKGKPVIHYTWDLYPFQLNDYEESKPYGRRLTLNGTRWREYVSELKLATEIWVPSKCTVVRTQEFVGKDAVVIKSPVYLWDPPKVQPPSLKGLKPFTYVVDVMRPYPTDPNVNACAQACKNIGIQCVEMRHKFDDEEFRWTVANALLLVSAYEEASTGGLTLLEGYAQGIPSLISDSPRHGGRDYLGDRASYFKWNSRQALEDGIEEHVPDLYPVRPTEGTKQRNRQWVEKEYSDTRFAKEMAHRIRVILGEDD